MIINIINPTCITINTHLSTFINNTITSIVGVVALVGIPFGIYLAHNVFVNSLAMASSLPTLMHKDMFEYLMPYIDILKLGVIICCKIYV
jgi:ABC-type proline/glycine betaine transport system permease subunit